MSKKLLLINKKFPSILFLILICVVANSQAPQQPASIYPGNGTIDYAGNTVSVTVTDPNGDPMTVTLYGHKKSCISTVPNFTIIGLPDTQFYTEELPGTNSAGGGHNGIFKAQTQWIADHRIDSNIAFAVQLGDCVQNGDTPPGIDDQIEWKRADTAIRNIEFPNVPVTDGIPYGICVGNHDQAINGSPTSETKYYNQYFGSARFAGRAYYGGQYGSNNDNHYQLFTSGGMDFIHISIEYYPNASDASLVTLQPVLDWADALLKAYPARQAILSSHNLLDLNNNFQGPGQKIYDELKDNPNLFLMLAGHVHGEGRRSDIYNGNTIHTLLSDYQNGYTNGGNGYLRIMQFRPAENIITVKTYSPYSNTSLTGSTSEFTIPLNSCPFTLIGTNTNVASGSSTTFTWPGLELSTDYE
ncbi:MAG: metallophosphoesterase [Ginsengibacter sp.]